MKSSGIPWLCLFGVACALTGGGCRRWQNLPQLEQRYQCATSFNECSPLIVVATNRKVVYTGRSVVMAPNKMGVVHNPPPMRVWLFEATADVENVLKGSLAQHEITYYFYGMPLGEAFVGQPTHYPGPGERYILLLRSEKGVLRTVIDYTDSPHTGIYTGSHAPEFLRPEWPLEERMARLMLQPGKAPNVVELAQDLLTMKNRAAALVGLSKTMDILEADLASPICEVRSVACLLLARDYPGHDSCLAAVERDDCLRTVQGEAAFLSLNIRRWRADTERRDRDLLARIANDEFREDFLRICLLQPDPRISSAARQALARMGCPQTR